MSILTIQDGIIGIRSTTEDTLSEEDLNNQTVNSFMAKIKCKHKKNTSENKRAV